MQILVYKTAGNQLFKKKVTNASQYFQPRKCPQVPPARHITNHLLTYGTYLPRQASEYWNWNR
jgi:hypothetical protein